jgi:hypothetical protein
MVAPQCPSSSSRPRCTDAVIASGSSRRSRRSGATSTARSSRSCLGFASPVIWFRTSSTSTTRRQRSQGAHRAQRPDERCLPRTRTDGGGVRPRVPRGPSVPLEFLPGSEQATDDHGEHRDQRGPADPPAGRLRHWLRRKMCTLAIRRAATTWKGWWAGTGLNHRHQDFSATMVSVMLRGAGSVEVEVSARATFATTSDTRRTTRPEPAYARRAGREIPSFSIRERSVWGWRPSFSAAWPFPSIFQPQPSSTRRMCTRSTSSRRSVT